MNTATLTQLVSMARAEAGHSLATSQGLNTVESLKHLIRRTEVELWTAFKWPMLTMRHDVPIQTGQVEYAFPSDMHIEQIAEAFWLQDTQTRWTKVEFGIPEDAILPNGAVPTALTSPTIQLWDVYYNTTADESRIRIWPKPSTTGYLRLKGQRALNQLVNDDDYCTLDSVLITLFVAAEMLARAKADDAGSKMQKAQRHLLKLRARLESDKQKVSTYGIARGVQANRFRSRPYLDYIP